MLWVFIVFTLVLSMFLLPALIGRSEMPLREVTKSLDIRLKQLKRDFQFQTKELKRRLASGDLDQEEWQRLTDELRKETANSITGTEQAAESGINTPIPIAYAIAVVVVVATAYTSYYYVGFNEQQSYQNKLIKFINNDPQAIDKLREIASEKQTEKAVSDLYLGLRSLVDVNPESVSDWREISRFNGNYGRTEEALAALKIAESIEPENIELKVDRAQIYANSKETSEIIEAHRLLSEALQVNPDHQGALIVRASIAYRIGMYDLAIRSWERLKLQMVNRPEMVSLLDERIAEAQQRLEGKSTTEPHESTAKTDTTDTTEVSKSSERPGIKLDVVFAPEIMDRLSGNEALFIFARAVTGPQFPIAVIRTRTGDLMGPVVLSDAQAMQAQFALSNYDEVKVSARISFTGSPTAVSGDIEAKPIQLKRPFPADAIQLVLDQVVP